jgi:Domain of unknown function (DUF4136)
MRTVAILVSAAALAGCASLSAVDADVSSFSRWPTGRAPSTYAFERLPSQQAQPQQAQMLEDAARRAIEEAGFVPVLEGSTADVTMQLGARITETDSSPFNDPFWYGGYGPWARPFGYAAYGRGYWRRGYWGPGAWAPYTWGWGPYSDFPYYQREVALLIRDKRSGDPLYEARAVSEGNSAGIPGVLPAMFAAALKDFPSGSAANPRRVTIPTTPAP